MTIISSNKLHKRDFNVDRMEEIKEVRPEINFTTSEAAKASFRVFYFKSAYFVEGFLFEKNKKTWKWSSFGLPHVGSAVTIYFFCLHVKWFIAGPPCSKITTNSHPGLPTHNNTLITRITRSTRTMRMTRRRLVGAMRVSLPSSACTSRRISKITSMKEVHTIVRSK